MGYRNESREGIQMRKPNSKWPKKLVGEKYLSLWTKLEAYVEYVEFKIDQ